MRYAARRDANEPDIIDALEAIGCSVQQLDGDGVPDLLVGRAGVNWLLEVKDGDKPASKRMLTASQVDWHRSWNGHVDVVESVNEALEAVR
jgi:hypothetical protein